MSELAVADGDLPPWVLESGDTAQVSAGETTRNQYAIPEPEKTVADSGSKGSVSQNQPAVADNTTPQDDTMIEEGTGGAKEYVPAATTAPKTVATTKSHADKAVAAAKNGKSKTTATTKGKKVTKVNKPTLVVYKVRKGDNLADIAARSHTTVAQIKEDSGLKSSTIRPGQVIKVRYTPAGYKSSSSKGSSSATSSAKGSYTVKAGDTISGIAKKNGVSTTALLSANGLSASDAAKLRAGRKLTIPSAASSSKKSAKSSSKSTKSSSKKKSTKRK